MVMDEPLDFEKEDPILPAPRPAKRKKVIGLDDLLLDYYESGKDELKVKPRKSKHGSKGYNSDDEDTSFREKEIEVSKALEVCEEQAGKIDTRDDVPLWGQKNFRLPETPLNSKRYGS
uniref:Uncharacterized protein n=1 Tax=Arundo donax TaxID=35708 RepID=A0A0A9B1V6_ARUDO